MKPEVVTPAQSDPIGALMPWTDGAERTLRNRLLRCQQYSTTRALQSASKTASGLFWLINSTAAAHATAAVPAEAESTCAFLRDLLAGLNRLETANG